MRVLRLFFEDVVVVVAMRDMVRKQRRKGQRVVVMWGFKEETRKHTERAVRRRSGREGRFFSGCCDGENISTAVIPYYTETLKVFTGSPRRRQALVA